MTGPRPTPHASPGAERQSAVTGRWSVVPALSGATFAVRDKLVAIVRGSMPVVDGVAIVSADGRTADVWLELPVPGIATGNGHRDRDLQRPAFLDAASHPTVRVAARQATATSTGWTARAEVFARGSEAPVDLTVETIARSSKESGDELRVHVTGRLDRRPLGIKVPTFVVGRFIDLEADLTFRRETDRA